MKNLILFTLLLLVSCDESIETTSAFCDNTDKMVEINSNFIPNVLFSDHSKIFYVSENPGFDKQFLDVYASNKNGDSLEFLFDISSDTSKSLFINFIGNLNDIIILPNGEYWIVTNYDNVFRSTDQGTTWESVLKDFKVEPHNLILNGNGVMYATSFWNGISSSYDFGETWTEITDEQGVAYDFRKFFDNKIYYYKRDKSLMVSNDEGNSWEEVTGISGEDLKYFYQFNGNAIKYSMIEWGKDKTYFMMTQHGSKEFCIYESDYDGKVWTGGEKIDFEVDGAYLDRLVCVDDNGWIYATANRSNLPSKEGIYRTKDKGQTWEQVLCMNLYNYNIDENGYVVYYDYSNFKLLKSISSIFDM